VVTIKDIPYRIKFIIVIVGLGVLSLYFFINPTSTALFPKCPFYVITGFLCPGCGSQRAIHHIMHGDIFLGLRQNYLFLILFFVLSYELFISLKTLLGQNTRNNLLHNKKITNTILVLVIVFWILRNIPVYPFILLAPQ